MQIVNYDGHLTDDQLIILGRMKHGVHKIQDMIKHLNNLSRETGLYFDTVDTVDLMMIVNDISRYAKKHEQAEEQIRKTLFESANNQQSLPINVKIVYNRA